MNKTKPVSPVPGKANSQRAVKALLKAYAEVLAAMEPLDREQRIRVIKATQVMLDIVS